jgi:subtilisin family serine protease
MRAGGPATDRDGNGRGDAKGRDRRSDGIGRGKAWTLSVPPQAGTYDNKQLLVPRPSGPMLKQLTDRGYTVSKEYRSGLVVLQLPNLPDFDAWDAQRQLQDMFPDGSFGLNFRYGPYRPEAEEMGREPLKTPSIEARDYGAALIKWSPTLAACVKGLKIGVIDTAIDKTHPSLVGDHVRVVKLPSMQGDGGGPHWHGTGVVSLLAGAPDSPAAGLIPQAQFLTANAFQNNAQGKPEADSARIFEALDQLDRLGVQIVNMSLVGPRDDLVHEQIKRMAASKGVVFVAAVGNGGPGAPKGYPAAYAEVIAVTAVDRSGASYDHAGRGTHVDVAAPGVKIRAAFPGGRTAVQTGTSFATPFVTAVVASVYRSTVGTVDLGVQEAVDPKAAILRRLFGKDRKRDTTYGLGLIQAPEKCGGGGQQVAHKPGSTPVAAAAPTTHRPPIIPTGASGWEVSIAGPTEPERAPAPTPELASQGGWLSVTRTSGGR